MTAGGWGCCGALRRNAAVRTGLRAELGEIPAAERGYDGALTGMTEL